MERVISFFKDQISIKHITRVIILIAVLATLPFLCNVLNRQFEENSFIPCIRNFYKDLGFSKHLKLIKSVLSSSMIPKRKLINDDENKDKSQENLIYSYEFFNNISDYIYHGNWTTATERTDNFPEFDNKFWGKLSVRFVKRSKKPINILQKNYQNDSVKATFYLYDGSYKDKWLNFNVSITLPSDNSSFRIEIKDTIVNYTYGEIMEKLFEGSMSIDKVESNFSLSGEFIRDEKKFVLDIGKIMVAEYSVFKGKLRLNNSIVEITSEIKDDSVYHFLI
jgi:hypothetical protein